MNFVVEQYILAGYLYPTLLTKSTVENSPFICFVYCSTTKFIFSFSFYRTGALMDNVQQGTTGNTLITWLTEEAIICGNVMF
jgi:hypothetical protein